MDVKLSLFLPFILVAAFVFGGIGAQYGHLFPRWQFVALITIIFFILYYLLLAYLAGAFRTCKAEEKEIGPYTYYYRSYQGKYRETANSFQNLLSTKQHDILHKYKGGYYFALYWDDPRTLENSSHCRSCIGYAVPANAGPETIEVLNSIDFKKVEIKKCRVVESSLDVKIKPLYLSL